jgi:uncharacterized membrane protein YdbT with pleckstrin-like domain
MEETTIVWKDRKRPFLGLPFSFTRYALTEEKLMIDVGFFARHEEEIRLYRILDITLTRTFGQRLFGVGTIHCCTADKTSPEVDIKHIRNSKAVKDMLSDMVEAQREAKRVSSREFIGDADDHDADDFDHIEE